MSTLVSSRMSTSVWRSRRISRFLFAMLLRYNPPEEGERSLSDTLYRGGYDQFAIHSAMTGEGPLPDAYQGFRQDNRRYLFTLTA